MRIAIFGSGGVGGYFGGRLAQSGQSVVFIARGAHLRGMQKNGLRVDSILGDFVLDQVEATDDPAAPGPVDAVILAVKAWQVPEAAGQMKPLVGPATVVVPLQNGVDAPAQLGQVLGSEHVLGGLCRISTVLSAPNHIKHVGVQPYIAFGELDGRQSTRVEALRQAFAACAGVSVQVPADIVAAMWEKFIFISAISGVGAVTRQTVGIFRTVPESRALLQAALAEAEAVGRAHGVRLSAGTAESTLAFIDGTPPGLVASMQRDMLEGRPSELEAQCGAVVRLGQAAGVPTPTHAFIYAALLPGELRARGLA